MGVNSDNGIAATTRKMHLRGKRLPAADKNLRAQARVKRVTKT